MKLDAHFTRWCADRRRGCWRLYTHLKVFVCSPAEGRRDSFLTPFLSTLLRNLPSDLCFFFVPRDLVYPHKSRDSDSARDLPLPLVGGCLRQAGSCWGRLEELLWRQGSVP